MLWSHVNDHYHRSPITYSAICTILSFLPDETKGSFFNLSWLLFKIHQVNCGHVHFVFSRFTSGIPVCGVCYTDKFHFLLLT